MFVLASASPRRRDLLAHAGHAFVVRAADIDEGRQAGEEPRPYARRLATQKAVAVSDLVGGFRVPVLAADTVVALDGEILDKPGTAERAIATLRRLSGATHRVHTAVVVRAGGSGWTRVVTTAVRFRLLTDTEIVRYVATGEPLDRAGAYAIQGGAGGFVHRLVGSYTNVVGLPLAEALAMLARAGVVPA